MNQDIKARLKVGLQIPTDTVPVCKLLVLNFHHASCNSLGSYSIWSESVPVPLTPSLSLLVATCQWILLPLAGLLKAVLLSPSVLHCAIPSLLQSSYSAVFMCKLLTLKFHRTAVILLEV